MHCFAFWELNLVCYFSKVCPVPTLLRCRDEGWRSRRASHQVQEGGEGVCERARRSNILVSKKE